MKWGSVQISLPGARWSGEACRGVRQAMEGSGEAWKKLARREKAVALAVAETKVKVVAITTAKAS